MKESNKRLLSLYGNDLELCSRVLAGEAEPTRAAFVSLSRLLSELLTQHEGALASLEKRKRSRKLKAAH